jgi:hypothetical protein
MPKRARHRPCSARSQTAPSVQPCRAGAGADAVGDNVGSAARSSNGFETSSGWPVSRQACSIRAAGDDERERGAVQDAIDQAEGSEPASSPTTRARTRSSSSTSITTCRGSSTSTTRQASRPASRCPTSSPSSSTAAKCSRSCATGPRATSSSARRINLIPMIRGHACEAASAASAVQHAGARSNLRSTEHALVQRCPIAARTLPSLCPITGPLAK